MPKKIELTAEQIEKITFLFHSGMGQKNIVKATGLTMSPVRALLRSLGLKHEKPTYPAKHILTEEDLEEIQRVAAQNQLMQKCVGPCGLEKLVSDFPFRKDQGKWKLKCKSCEAESNKKKYQENKEDRKIKTKINYQKNREKILTQQKEYNKNKTDEQKQKRKEYIKIYGASISDEKRIKRNKKNAERKRNNREKVREQERKYRKNSNKRLNYEREYRNKNRDKLNAKEREKTNNNLEFKFKKIVSGAIRLGLKRNNSGKFGKSCQDYLGYTFEELVIHFENQFKLPGNEWMNFSNRGIYNSQNWDDNDPSTWKWQIDHIIPHSDFKYTNMDCEEFKACWALSNLRPYSAKQNLIDGSTRIRHKK